MHGASAGAVPLPVRQTTIAWPLVGVKGDGAIRIMDCRAGTRQAALGLMAQTPGAATIYPGTSRPPGRASAEARDCEGAPGRILTSTGSGGPGPGGEIGPQRRRGNTRRRSWTRQGHWRRGRTTRTRRDGDTIGTGGDQSPCHYCGRGSGRCGHRDPGIRCSRRRRLTLYHRQCPLGARVVPAEAATPTLYLQGSNIRRDPLNLAGGLPGSHQGVRPGGDLPLPVGGEGSLPLVIIWLHRHATRLQSPVHVRARGSVCQSPE